MGLFKKCERCNGTGELPVGDQFRKLRKKHGMTLQQVADKMGVTIVYVSDFERGQRSMTRARGEEFLAALHQD